MTDFTSEEKEKLPSYLLDKSPINRGFGRDMAVCNTVLRMFVFATEPVIRLAEESVNRRTGKDIRLLNPYTHLIEWTENNQMVLYDASRLAFERMGKIENRFDKEKEETK